MSLEAFSLAGPARGTAVPGAAQRFLGAQERPAAPADLGFAAGVLAAAALGAAAFRAAGMRAARPAASRRPTFMPLASAVAPAAIATFRERLVACRAKAGDDEAVPSAEETDRHMEEIQEIARQVVGGTAAAVVFVGTSMAESAEAYPIFAQQNYKYPQEATGKLACANCHLAKKPLDVKLPHEVLPDTIFKIEIEIPSKYETRQQLIASGEKGPLNVGAIAVMPEGWKLAPKARLPKAIKKELKGLAWAPYSKDLPNILVAGPVPGAKYEKVTLPVLAPDPNNTTSKDVQFGRYTMYFGGNRGRGQVYPEGNQSNVNQFFAPAAGKVTGVAPDGANTKVTIQKQDGTEASATLLPGAYPVVEVGEVVQKDDPLTTNPNVGGFGQEEKDIFLQDVNRLYGYTALSISIFVAQLAFVLKKKQFEKVQLAEGF